MTQKLTQAFVELLQQEIERVMEIHQVELETRLDRIVKRIDQLETTCIGLTRVAVVVDQLKEDINRQIAEAELAIRKHFDGMLAPLQRAIDEQNALLKNMQDTIAKMGPPAAPEGGDGYQLQAS